MAVKLRVASLGCKERMERLMAAFSTSFHSCSISTGIFKMSKEHHVEAYVSMVNKAESSKSSKSPMVPTMDRTTRRYSAKPEIIISNGFWTFWSSAFDTLLASANSCLPMVNSSLTTRNICSQYDGSFKCFRLVNLESTRRHRSTMALRAGSAVPSKPILTEKHSPKSMCSPDKPDLRSKDSGSCEA